jgi:hypothetical protein
MRAVSIAGLCVASALSTACTTTRTMTRPLSAMNRKELAAALSDEWVLEYTAALPPPGGEARARDPHLDGDSLRFTSVDGGPRVVPIQALRSIETDVSHAGGAVQGIGVGALAGLAAGGLFGLSLGTTPPNPEDHDCGPCFFTAKEKAMIFGVIGAVAGAGVGLIVGALRGHRDVVELSDRDR